MKFALTQPKGQAITYLWAGVNLTYDIGRHHPGSQIERLGDLSKVGEIADRKFHWYAWADRLTEGEKQAIRKQTTEDALTLLLVTHRLSK
jgi:hypothetical protein